MLPHLRRRAKCPAANLPRFILLRNEGIMFQQYNLFTYRTARDNSVTAPGHVPQQDRARVETRARE